MQPSTTLLAGLTLALTAPCQRPEPKVEHELLTARAEGVTGLSVRPGEPLRGAWWRETGELLLQEGEHRLRQLDGEGQERWSWRSGQKLRHVHQDSSGRCLMLMASAPHLRGLDPKGSPRTLPDPYVAAQARGCWQRQDGGFLLWTADRVHSFDPEGRRTAQWQPDGITQITALCILPGGDLLLAEGDRLSRIGAKGEVHARFPATAARPLDGIVALTPLANGRVLIRQEPRGGKPRLLDFDLAGRIRWQHQGQPGSVGAALGDLHRALRHFVEQTEPVLAQNCYRCHGTRDKPVKGDLWLRTRRNVIRGGSHGPIIDPVDLGRSRVLRYINHETSEHQMPPKQKLPDAEIQAIRRWVLDGVAMPVREAEWVYEPPSLLTPAARAHWAFQPIADPQLPRTAATAAGRDPIDRFVAARLAEQNLTPGPVADRATLIRRLSYTLRGLPPDPGEVEAFVESEDPQAWPALIDRYLASPQYGEHWGRHWLDLARFAETNGYERDSKKPEAWRYRQYVIDSFNTNKPYDRFLLEQLAGDELPDKDAASITGTGFLRLGIWDDEPADREQALFEEYDDLVRTSSEVFLGLTLGCARCHDHKLDPLPQRDYYRFLAHFRGLKRYSNAAEQVLTDVSTPAQRAALAAENRRRAAAREEVHAQLRELRQEFVAARSKAAGEALRQPDMREVRFKYYRDTFRTLPDFDLLRPETLGALEHGFFDTGVRTRRDSYGFVFSGRLIVPQRGRYTFVLDSDDGARLLLDGEEKLRYDGIHGLGKPRRVSVELAAGEVPIRLDYFQWKHGFGLKLDWHGPGVPRRSLMLPGTPGRSLDNEIRHEGQKLMGAAWHGRFEDLQRRLRGLRDAPSRHRVLSAKEVQGAVPKTHVLIRGSAHAHGDEVTPGFPEILGGGDTVAAELPGSSGRRLALARWMLREDHPLTARVMVNRIWQFHFGRGLVRSSSDFGMQGRRPTHPRLLDHLAKAFIASGWDIKALHRRILNSAAFRQSAAHRPDAHGVDPQNDLFWRFDRRRMGAEEIRDSMLWVAGTLDLEAFGGPSVYPHLPRAVLATQSSPKWRENTPESHNRRRSVYTLVMRSLQDPLLEGFDAATTDVSCAVRFQTSQPTQALNTLNSDFALRKAAQMAARLAAEAGDEPQARVRLGLRLVLGQEPDAAQVARGVRFVAEFPDAPNSPLAWEQFCLLCLNLNAFFFVD